MRNLPDIIPDPVCASGVGEGWWPTLEQLHIKIIEIDANYIIDQIKEKFGGLRYYVTTSETISLDDQDEIHALIYKAERKCNRTCEWCGEPGYIHPGPKDQKEMRWLITLCDGCEEKRNQDCRPNEELCLCGRPKWKHGDDKLPLGCKSFRGTGKYKWKD